ncbi:hypothetical protein Maes01_01499 [Microbulbifer aestuariivivens]|uniref:VCBS repeat-containing protein n=1 Tax=Microbulbifer aestuariivivens TaxID=1908308 RepID=A0ABP9WPB5_9GAMM
MRRLKQFFTAVLLLVFSAIVSSQELNVEVGIYANSESITESQKFLLWDLERLASELSVSRLKDIHSLVKINGERKFGVLNYSSDVGVVDLDRGVVSGPWPISPYKEHLFLSGEYLAAAEKIAAVHGRKFSVSDDPLSVAVEREFDYYFDQSLRPKGGGGCLSLAPLRYGDIDGDSSSELVLFFRKGLILFSLEDKRVMFSAHYLMGDEIPAGEVERYFPGQPKAGEPIFLSRSGASVLVMEKIPAWRPLSKIYFGDFDEDGKRDIILWRKLFESNKHGDNSGGFKGLGEVFVHYSLRDGMYSKESTDRAVVQEWLSSNNLTWKKGFPTKSECIGSVGDLIPEMHDPLLNDPEVLQ